jgi:hypothetical protein
VLEFIASFRFAAGEFALEQEQDWYSSVHLEAHYILHASHSMQDSDTNCTTQASGTMQSGVSHHTSCGS